MTVFEEASVFALIAHAGMKRKVEGKPYILHPMEVASIAATMTDDEDVLAAAVLHDVVEDTGTKPEEIEARFGKRIAALVASETEDKRPDLPSEESWLVRKEESLKVLAESADRAVKILWLSDKLSNLRSFCEAKRLYGDRLWDSFNQKDPARQEWYYRSVAEHTEELADTSAGREYARRLDCLFGGNDL